MKTAASIFSILKQRLHSAEFLETSRINPSAFTRNRFFTCPIIVSFVLNLLRKSIPKEMISFCNHCKIERVSRSAITQARSKLSPHAFVDLNDILVKEFYTDNSFDTFYGLRVFAVDGSTLELPINSQEIIDKYGFASNQTEIKIPMARTSHLYDVINGIAIDAIIAPYSIGERDLAIQHLEKLRANWSLEDLKDILIIFDRGYPSAALIIYLLKYNINFLMRCNSKFIKEVDDAVKRGKQDTIIDFSARRTGKSKAEIKRNFPDLNMKERFSIRVILIALSSGEQEVLLTSLMDKNQYSYQIFKELYFKRWGIEENYKFYKVQLEIENFSGKSCRVIEQDFYATVLAANARALLAVEATREMASLQSSYINIAERKYAYTINKKVSVEQLKNEFVAILIAPEADIEHFCERVKKTMKNNLIPIRPKRSFRRQRKHKHRKYYMHLR